MSLPTVSVLIPSYNHEKYVKEAIESVLNQTFQDFEIIITDDGSTDETVDKIKEFEDDRVQLYVFEENQGACVAVNNCIKKAKGKFIAILSSDDIWEPKKLEKQINFFEENPDIPAVFTKAKIIDEKGNDFKDQNHFYYSVFDEENRSRSKWLNHFFFKGNCLCHPSLLIKRSLYDEIGLYNESMANLPDFDFWIRLCLKYDIYILEEKLIRFRVRDNELNASGLRIENSVRVRFEAKQLFDNFLIDDVDLLQEIFPELSNYRELIPELIPYFLGRLACETNIDFKELWGLEQIFSILQSTELSDILKNEYDYEFSDFLEMSSKMDCFNLKLIDAKSNEINSLKIKNKKYKEREINFKNMITNKNKKIKVLKNHIHEIYSSNSWRLMSPFRKIGKTLRNIKNKPKIAIILKSNFHIKELRRNLKAYNLINQSKLFNENYYKKQVHGLKNNPINPIIHYMYICHEKNPSKEFNGKFYLKKNPSVVKLGLNPLVHYLLFGKKEGKEIKPTSKISKLNKEGIVYTNPNVDSDEYVKKSDKFFKRDCHDPKLIAFHLPQFYSFKENDMWWGKGFTEWTNSTSAKPQFEGHYQPHLPDELGFYDLSNNETFHKQISLAKKYGIYGFCFHYYWFAGGKRLMEKPIFNYLNDKTLDFPFMLCWANETWARGWWDSSNDEVLMKQYYDEDYALDFIKDIFPFFLDDRYIKINNCPVLIFYNPLEPGKETTEKYIKIWRKYIKKQGFDDLYILSTERGGEFKEWGFDAFVEFPPQWTNREKLNNVKLYNPKVNGKVYDFQESMKKTFFNTSKKNVYKCVVPSWDNTARRKQETSIFANSSPVFYEKWLSNAINETIKFHPENKLLFINAWNEWGEGCHLEPDKKYGFAYLESTLKVLTDFK